MATLVAPSCLSSGPQRCPPLGVQKQLGKSWAPRRLWWVDQGDGWNVVGAFKASLEYDVALV